MISVPRARRIFASRVGNPLESIRAKLFIECILRFSPSLFFSLEGVWVGIYGLGKIKARQIQTLPRRTPAPTFLTSLLPSPDNKKLFCRHRTNQYTTGKRTRNLRSDSWLQPPVPVLQLSRRG